MNNLFFEYKLVVVIGESSIHNLFSSYNSILVIIQGVPKVLGTF